MLKEENHTINQNDDDDGSDIHVAVMAHNDKWKNDDLMMMLLIFMRLAVMAHNVDREEIGVWSHLILA